MRERSDRPKHHEKHSDLRGVKPLLRGLGGTPGGCARAHPPEPGKNRERPVPSPKRGESLQASTITPFEAWGLLSGTIIRGTPNAPNHGWLTPSNQLTGVVQAKTSSARGTRSHPSLASGWNNSPRQVHASPEGLLRQRVPPRLSRGPARAGFVVKQPWPYRLTNRPLCRHIKCRGCLTPYPDTRASVGQAEVTAVTLPLFFTDRYDRKTAPLAPLRLPCQLPWQRLTASHDQSPSSSLGRNRKLRLARPHAPASGADFRLARPHTPASGGDLRLARPPDSASTPVSGGIVSSPDPGLGLKRSLRLDRPWARTDRANRGYIISLFLACSG
jgi:hypothetical protein